MTVPIRLPPLDTWLELLGGPVAGGDRGAVCEGGQGVEKNSWLAGGLIYSRHTQVGREGRDAFSPAFQMEKPRAQRFC